MVNYECYRCGYTNNNKSNIVRHIGRKNTCKSILNNINLDVYKEYILDGLTYEDYLKTTKIPQNTTKYAFSPIEIPQNTTKCNDFECIFCEKKYSRLDSLNRHFKTCKDKKKDDEAKESMNKLVTILNSQINDFKKVIEKKDKQIDELIKKAGINNSTITQNIQNNIKVLAYKNILKCSCAGRISPQ